MNHVKRSLLVDSVLQYPQLCKVVLFCCTPQHKSVSVPVKLSISGLLVATNGKEYKSIQDWFYSELYPRLPENKATSYDIPQSNRDFFTKPDRKGISFQTLISKISIGEHINNILPITNEISFCSLSVNSLLNSYELVLYSLMSVTGLNINVVNYQLLEDIATTLCKDSDNTFCHSDVISYVTNSDDILTTDTPCFMIL
jgi:hypothetical protein